MWKVLDLGANRDLARRNRDMYTAFLSPELHSHHEECLDIKIYEYCLSRLEFDRGQKRFTHESAPHFMNLPNQASIFQYNDFQLNSKLMEEYISVIKNVSNAFTGEYGCPVIFTYGARIAITVYGKSFKNKPQVTFCNVKGVD